MRVLVDDDVIENAVENSDFIHLHELMAHACRQRHFIIGNFEPWLGKLDVHTCNGYRSALAYSIRAVGAQIQGTATIHIKKNARGLWVDPLAELSLVDALRLLQEPLGIIVENAKNDWNFLRKISTTITRDLLDKALADGWITILHGGGADMVANISSRANYKYQALRTFAMFDSDRHHPDELDSNWIPIHPIKCQGYLTEQSALQYLGNRYWRLERRFIESYLPKSEVEVVEASNGNIPRGASDVLFRLPKKSRWYYNMKNGFAYIKNSAHIRQQALYDAVTDRDKMLLAIGFPNAASRYTDSDADFAWDKEAQDEAKAQLPKLLRLI